MHWTQKKRLISLRETQARNLRTSPNRSLIYGNAGRGHDKTKPVKLKGQLNTLAETIIS